MTTQTSLVEAEHDRPGGPGGEARIVDLDSGTVGVLLAHKLVQDAEREQWGDAYQDHGLVFARADGTPLYGDDMTKRLMELCGEAGVRTVRLHLLGPE